MWRELLMDTQDIHLVLGFIAFCFALLGIMGLFSIASALESVAREISRLRRKREPVREPYVSQSERADRAALVHYKGGN